MWCMGLEFIAFENHLIILLAISSSKSINSMINWAIVLLAIENTSQVSNFPRCCTPRHTSSTLFISSANLLKIAPCWQWALMPGEFLFPAFGPFRSIKTVPRMQHSAYKASTWLHSDHKPGKYFHAAPCSSTSVGLFWYLWSAWRALWSSGARVLWCWPLNLANPALCVCNILTGTKSETPVEQQRVPFTSSLYFISYKIFQRTKMQV